MQVTLSDDGMRTIHELLGAGVFATPDEAIDAALGQLLLSLQPSEWWEEARSLVAAGVESLRGGRKIRGDQSFYDDLRAYAERRAAEHSLPVG